MMLIEAPIKHIVLERLGMTPLDFIDEAVPTWRSITLKQNQYYLVWDAEILIYDEP